MNTLVKVTAPVSGNLYYINGAVVLYWQPTSNGGTIVHFQGSTLKVDTSIDEIMAQL